MIIFTQMFDIVKLVWIYLVLTVGPIQIENKYEIWTFIKDTATYNMVERTSSWASYTPKI